MCLMTHSRPSCENVILSFENVLVSIHDTSILLVPRQRREAAGLLVGTVRHGFSLTTFRNLTTLPTPQKRAVFHFIPPKYYMISLFTHTGK